MVSNNGTLSRALVRLDCCITSRSGAHRTEQLIVGHRLVQGPLEATIVDKASFWHSCCWWAPPTPNPSHSAAKTPLPGRGTPTADGFFS